MAAPAMSTDLHDSLRLIGITDRHVMGLGGLAEAAAGALAAGLPALMLREKDLPEDQLLPLASGLRALTNEHGALLIVNRRLKIARAVGADGVHLGDDGPTLEEARSFLGLSAILGYSAHAPNEALTAFERGADYVVFSPIYETPSKEGILQPVGVEALARLVRSAPGPIVARGGVSLDRVSEIASAGAAGVAVIRAIFAQRSPREATEALLECWAKPRAANTPPAEDAGE